jgi:hypothetical protein
MMCHEEFNGSTAWEQHMEHVAQHLQGDDGLTDPMGAWKRCDPKLEAYMLTEGIVIKHANGA